MIKQAHIITLILSGISINIFNCSSSGNEITPSNSSKVTIEAIKTYSGSNNESFQGMSNTSDGGYVAIGYVQSNDGDFDYKANDSYDYLVSKFNSQNVLEWSKTYGGSLNDRGNTIIQTLDNGYVFAGYSESSDGDVTENFGSKDIWLAKLDGTGTLVWQKSLGFLGIDGFSSPNIAASLIQTNDGGYLVTGTLDVTASEGQGNSKVASVKHAGGDYWVIKLDADGNKEWSKFYGGALTDTPFGVVQAEDGYIITGSSDSEDVDVSNNKGSYDYWVIKISSTGALIWERSFGGSGIDEAREIVSAGDGNFLIVGDARSDNIDVSINKGAADVWLIKINSDGGVIWEKTFGGSSFDSARSITKTQDNNFLICGNSRSNDGDLNVNKGQNDIWVLKIDVNANLEWQQTIGGSLTDLAYGVVELADKTIIIAGDTYSSDGDIPGNNGFKDALLITLKEK